MQSTPFFVLLKFPHKTFSSKKKMRGGREDVLLTSSSSSTSPDDEKEDSGTTEEEGKMTAATNHAKMREPAEEEKQGEHNEEEEKVMSVKVAVMVRPMLEEELVDGNDIAIFADEEKQSISCATSDHTFTYDHVYSGEDKKSEKKLYDNCVEPLVSGLLNGLNGTVLAYGQTGSGKTYTMGTSAGATFGVVPRVVRALFEEKDKITESGSTDTISIRVGFVEIHKEEIRDLLSSSSTASKKLVQTVITLRENANGGICLNGASEIEVKDESEMAELLSSGAKTRATGSTNMNKTSSRSHAIFTIYLERRSTSPESSSEVTLAKLHLVDLAGSERQKRTKAEGKRLQEGIDINKGLLALGNVISALGDDTRRAANGHVPYRDSKLTRVLQDSLGGNSQTVFIACASPADSNAEETLNTLKYANRARNIKNMVRENKEEASTAELSRCKAQLAAMRSQVIALTQALNKAKGGDGEVKEDEVVVVSDELSGKLAASEREVRRLKAELAFAEEAQQEASEKELLAITERDALRVALEKAGGIDPTTAGCISKEAEDDDTGIFRGYNATIQALRAEVKILRRQVKRNLESEDEEYKTQCISERVDEEGEEEEEEDIDNDYDEEEQNQNELDSVEKTLRMKEKRMLELAKKAGTNSGADELRKRYEELVEEVENERKLLVEERERVHQAVLKAKSTGGQVLQKRVEKEQGGKLKELEMKLQGLQKQLKSHKETLRAKEQSDMMQKQLKNDILQLKRSRVELVRKMEEKTKERIAKQRETEKALMQAKKEGLKMQREAQKFKNQSEKQSLVLKRRTEEAQAVKKRLNDLQMKGRIQSHTASSLANVRSPIRKNNTNAPANDLIKSASLSTRRKWVDAEIKTAATRLAMREKLDELYALRAKGDTTVSNELIAEINEKVTRADEIEDKTGGVARRWAGVRALGEARQLLQLVFNAAVKAEKKSLKIEDVSANETHSSLDTHVNGKTEKDSRRGGGEEEEVMINEELYKDVPALEDTTPQRRKFVGTEKSPASQQYISSAEDSDGEEEIESTENDDPDYTPETPERTLLKENSVGFATPLNYVFRKAATFFGRGADAREPLQENNNI